MAWTAKFYGSFFEKALNKEIDFAADTLKLTLHTSSYSPDQDAHEYQDDLTNELSTGGGYTSGGVTLANASVTYTAGSNVLKIDADDITISNSTLTWRTAVLADTSPGSASTNPLICYFQNSENVVSSGGDTVIQFNSSGIGTITVS